MKDIGSIRIIKSGLNVNKEPEKINILSLIKTLSESNKTFKMSFVGAGEPLLIPNIIEACEEISKNHYLAINTNLVTGKVAEFANKINPKRVIFVHASLHIKELERCNLVDSYVNNFLLYKEKGFNICAREVGYPPLLKEVSKYMQYFKAKGIDLAFGPFLGWYRGKKYPRAYTKKELGIFGLDNTETSGIKKRFYQHGQFCNAGYNVGIVLGGGKIQGCHKIRKSIGNIYQQIEFRKGLIKCPYNYCNCPLKIYDSYLFEKALSENNIRIGK